MNEYFGFIVEYTVIVADEEDNGEEVMKPVSKKCTKIIETIEKELVFFDGIRHVGFSERFLNMYRPPTGIYIEGLAEKIIKFFEERLYYPSALHEL